MESRGSPNDHRAVRVVFRLRRASTTASIQAKVCAMDGYTEHLRGQLSGPRDLTTKISIFRKAARRTRVAQDAALRRTPVDHSCHVSRDLRIFSAAHGRAEALARQLCRQVEAYAGYAQTLQEVASVEASSMPETFKSAKTEKARRVQAMYRLRRCRVGLDAMYDQTGNMLDNATDIAAEILRHWGLVFAERPTNPVAQGELLRLAFEQHHVGDWQWQRGAWKEDVAAGRHEASPGPDGLPYVFGREAPEEWPSLIDGLGERMVSGGSAPRWALATRTVCIPKSEYHSDAQAVVRKAGSQHIDEHARQEVDRTLARVASVTVAPPQRGFVAGRAIDQNTHELEGAFLQ